LFHISQGLTGDGRYCEACEPLIEFLVSACLPTGGIVALTLSRPLTLVNDDWRAAAACQDTDPDLFFPVGTTGPAIEQIQAAKTVCDACPSKDPCLQFALTTNQDSGVWGGTSEEERRKLRRAWVAQQRRSA
jgi:WhiB family redox-sensing transcriptional regulator